MLAVGRIHAHLALSAPAAHEKQQMESGSPFPVSTSVRVILTQCESKHYWY